MSEEKEDKPKVYQLSHNIALRDCITHIRDCGLNGEYEVIVRKIKQGKTLSQLGGLFGAWIDYLSGEIGESVDYLHRELKSKFLTRIYINDHLDSEAKAYPSEIDAWVELLEVYHLSGNTLKFAEHSKRISLSWATLDQTKKYMKAIEQHYQSVGMPLPILDKFRKYYK